MRSLLVLALTTALASPVGATSLGHFDQLRNDPTLASGLRAIAIADTIRKECPSIKARMIRALNFLNGLERHARNMGYSEELVKAYVDSDAEKARVRGEARAYLASQGVVDGNAQSYCTAGQAEMARGSQVGRLLR